MTRRAFLFAYFGGFAAVFVRNSRQCAHILEAIFIDVLRKAAILARSDRCGIKSCNVTFPPCQRGALSHLPGATETRILHSSGSGHMLYWLQSVGVSGAPSICSDSSNLTFSKSDPISRPCSMPDKDPVLRPRPAAAWRLGLPSMPHSWCWLVRCVPYCCYRYCFHSYFAYLVNCPACLIPRPVGDVQACCIGSLNVCNSVLVASCSLPS